MSSSVETRRVAARLALPRLGPWPLAGLAVAVAFGAFVAFNALRDPAAYDIGLALEGGEVAWETGRPEQLTSWISTPFLAMVMALASLVVDQQAAGIIVTLLNLAIAVACIAWAAARLRPAVPPWAFAVALAGMATFAPLASTIWWKQLNLIAFGAAFAGFVLARRGRALPGGVLIGLSLSVKPILILLPLMLLLRRETRRTGLIAVAAIAVFNLAGQAFLAWRDGSLRTLWPDAALENFNAKAQPGNFWSCHHENFAPTSLVCRLVGADDWMMVRLTAFAIAAFFIVMAFDALRRRRGFAWDAFALAAALSPMLSPLAWSHYQLLLAPLLVLLVAAFARHGATLTHWAWLGVGYALTMLVWRPEGSLPGLARELVKGEPESLRILFSVFSVAQFGQYVVLVTAALWYASTRPHRPAPPTVVREEGHERDNRHD